MSINSNNNGLSDLALANVEALASEATGNTVDCYSESSYKYGDSYYDCGDCVKEKDTKGKGNKRTCTT